MNAMIGLGAMNGIVNPTQNGALATSPASPAKNSFEMGLVQIRTMIRFIGIVQKWFYWDLEIYPSQACSRHVNSL